MIDKNNVRWYVELKIGNGWSLFQTNSPIEIAQFKDQNEARWICNRLNSGRELCIAVSNLLEHATWSKGEPADLIYEAFQALIRYKRES